MSKVFKENLVIFLNNENRIATIITMILFILYVAICIITSNAESLVYGGFYWFSAGLLTIFCIIYFFVVFYNKNHEPLIGINLISIVFFCAYFAIYFTDLNLDILKIMLLVYFMLILLIFSWYLLDINSKYVLTYVFCLNICILLMNLTLLKIPDNMYTYAKSGKLIENFLIADYTSQLEEKYVFKEILEQKKIGVIIKVKANPDAKWSHEKKGFSFSSDIGVIFRPLTIKAYDKINKKPSELFGIVTVDSQELVYEATQNRLCKMYDLSCEDLQITITGL